MPKVSAGLVMYRRRQGTLEVLLVHPGGPYWKGKKEKSWSIPKGGIDPHEDALGAAQRELTEETGLTSQGPYLPLGSIQQKGGKVVHAWAFEGDCDAERCRSIEFELEWPPKSGKMARFPEIDHSQWFDLPAARKAINPGQVPLLDKLEASLA